MSWRKVTTILKDVLLSAAAKSNFVKQVTSCVIPIFYLCKKMEWFAKLSYVDCCHRLCKSSQINHFEKLSSGL